MLVALVLSCMCSIVAMIVGAVVYLAVLICDQSDDSAQSDALALDIQQFSSTPNSSPSAGHQQESSPPVEAPEQDVAASESSSANVEAPLEAPRQQLDSRSLASSYTTAMEPASSAGSRASASVELKSSPVKAEPGPRESDDSFVRAHKAEISRSLGPATSKLVFEDFDVDEMKLGGTAFHWCKSRKYFDKLIRSGLAIDAANIRGETALHVAVRRRKLQVIIGLLGHSANTEIINAEGETALIMAVKGNDIFGCQLLLIFDANVDALDRRGLSARHYAANSCERYKTATKSLRSNKQPSAAHLILAMLSDIGARRCAAGARAGRSLGCKQGCSHSGSYNGNSYDRWLDLSRESLYKLHMFQDILGGQRAACEPAGRLSRLLCIDGGGMRGVIVCQSLIELQKHLKRPVLSYFDWVGGTSVGAFLACALCNGLSLGQLRRVTFDVKDEIFSGNKPYNSKLLERFFKRTLGKARMSSIKDKKLAVTTVIADRDPCQLRLFRNYNTPAQMLEGYGFPAHKYDSLSMQSNVKLLGRVAGVPEAADASLPAAAQARIYPSGCRPAPANLAASSSLGGQSNGAAVGNAKTATSKAPSPGSSGVQATILDDIDELNGLQEALRPAAGNSSPANNPAEPADPVIAEHERDPFMWQAVRASAAAPFFFKPYGPYLDGGIISNNPTMDMLTEFFAHEAALAFLRARVSQRAFMMSSDAGALERKWPPPPHQQPASRLGAVVSLGTGRAGVVGREAMMDFSGFSTVFSPIELLRSIRAARDLFRKVVHQTCQTEEHILDRAQSWCASLAVPYFRINPPLAAIFSIDDKRDEQLINALWQTKLYMRAMGPQLRQLAAILERQ